MTKEKKIDAVQMMRTIREKINREWKDNPNLIEKHLKEIREKLNIKEIVQPEKSI